MAERELPPRSVCGENHNETASRGLGCLEDQDTNLDFSHVEMQPGGKRLRGG